MRLKEVYISARDPYERGLQHGSQASEEIRRGCIEYRPAFKRKGYTWDEARELAMKFVPYLQQSMPDLMEEAKGIADGAKVELSDVMVLNTRYELLKFKKDQDCHEPESQDAECTVYAVEPSASADKKLYMGQNWDNSPFIGKNLYMLHIDEQNGTKILELTEPAQLCRSGMNNWGIGLSCATLLSTKDHADVSIPTNFMRRRLLQCRTMEEADKLLAEFKPSVSLNYLVGSGREGRAHLIESNPLENYTIEPSLGVLGHGNDFVGNPTIDRFIPADSHFTRHFRGQRLAQLLAAKRGNIDVDHIMMCLKDHYGYPASVCNHNPEDGLQTIASTIYCLDKGYAYICWGNPCQNEYEKYEL